jgi:hypothetical protein
MDTLSGPSGADCYLARVMWLPDGCLCAQVQNRAQVCWNMHRLHCCKSDQLYYVLMRSATIPNQFAQICNFWPLARLYHFCCLSPRISSRKSSHSRHKCQIRCAACVCGSNSQAYMDSRLSLQLIKHFTNHAMQVGA